MCVCLDDLWLILYVLLCAYKINASLSLSLSRCHQQDLPLKCHLLLHLAKAARWKR